jgi:hypothetical protein
VRSMTSLASSHELDAEALERAITRPLPTARGKSVPITSRESYFRVTLEETGCLRRVPTFIIG